MDPTTIDAPKPARKPFNGTEPNEAYLAQMSHDTSIQLITLLEREWPIPLLAPAQNRYVIPAVLRLGQTMDKWAMASTGDGKLGVVIPEFTTEQFDDLTTVVYWSLRRAHPSITWDVFINTAMNVLDLISAFAVCAMQTGLIQRVKEGEQQPGEPAAENPPTGTAS